MAVVEVGPGVCLGFGGTNARIGFCEQGDVQRFQSVPTPHRPSEFFAWLAKATLDAAGSGASWVVAGFPGPVSEDGTLVGPMENVKSMNTEQFNLVDQMTASDPAVERLLAEGFSFVAVNDGPLAAQAAAHRMGEGQFNKVAALIIGTGQGAGIVIKDTHNPHVYRTDRTNPAETGHGIRSEDPYDTEENDVSGRALTRRYGKPPEELEPSHPAWVKVGRFVGRKSLDLGLWLGAQLVVPTGGVGIGASDKYQSSLREQLRKIEEYGNATQRLLLPEVRLVPPGDEQIFELFGAEGLMTDIATSPPRIAA